MVTPTGLFAPQRYLQRPCQFAARLRRRVFSKGIRPLAWAGRDDWRGRRQIRYLLIFCADREGVLYFYANAVLDGAFSMAARTARLYSQALLSSGRLFAPRQPGAFRQPAEGAKPAEKIATGMQQFPRDLISLKECSLYHDK